MKALGTSEALHVIGDSHVRAFARHARCLPLFAAPGRRMTQLTPSLAAETHRRVLAIARRIDIGQPIMLALTEPDIRFHRSNEFGTRQIGEADDGPALEHICSNYGSLIAQLKSLGHKRLVVWQSVPTFQPGHNDYARSLNLLLQDMCKKYDVTFLNAWADLVDGSSGLPKEELKGDDYHLSDAACGIAIRALKAIGCLEEKFPEVAEFHWYHAMRFDIGDGCEFRIWGDVRRDENEDRLFRSKLAEFVAARSIRALANCKAWPVVVPKAQQGLVAFRFFQAGWTNITAFVGDDASLRQAERVRALLRANEVRIRIGEADGLSVDREAVTDAIVVSIDPELDHSGFVEQHSLALERARGAIILNGRQESAAGEQLGVRVVGKGDGSPYYVHVVFRDKTLAKKIAKSMRGGVWGAMARVSKFFQKDQAVTDFELERT